MVLLKRILGILKWLIISTTLQFASLGIALIMWRAVATLAQDGRWPLVYAMALIRGHWDEPFVVIAFLGAVGLQLVKSGWKDTNWSWRLALSKRNLVITCILGTLLALLPAGVVLYIAVGIASKTVRSLVQALSERRTTHEETQDSNTGNSRPTVPNPNLPFQSTPGVTASDSLSRHRS
jgi:hypothetical protein